MPTATTKPTCAVCGVELIPAARQIGLSVCSPQCGLALTRGGQRPRGRAERRLAGHAASRKSSDACKTPERQEGPNTAFFDRPETWSAIRKGFLSPGEFLKSLRSKDKRHKYGVSAPSDRTADGIKFDSKREMNRYCTLKRLQSAGEVQWFTRQVPFHLPVADLYGRVIRYEVYVADFVVQWRDGSWTVEDVKGVRTREYVRKKRRVKECYGVEVVEV